MAYKHRQIWTNRNVPYTDLEFQLYITQTLEIGATLHSTYTTLVALGEIYCTNSELREYLTVSTARIYRDRIDRLHGFGLLTREFIGKKDIDISWIRRNMNESPKEAHIWYFISPTGERIGRRYSGISGLARSYGLTGDSLLRLVRGERKSFKGWTLAPSDDIRQLDKMKASGNYDIDYRDNLISQGVPEIFIN